MCAHFYYRSTDPWRAKSEKESIYKTRGNPPPSSSTRRDRLVGGEAPRKRIIFCACLDVLYRAPPPGLKTRNEKEIRGVLPPPHETTTHPLASSIPPLVVGEAATHTKRCVLLHAHSLLGSCGVGRRRLLTYGAVVARDGTRDAHYGAPYVHVHLKPVHHPLSGSSPLVLVGVVFALFQGFT